MALEHHRARRQPKEGEQPSFADERFMTAYQESFGVTKKQRPQTTVGPRKQAEPLLAQAKKQSVVEQAKQTLESKRQEEPAKELATVASQRRFGQYTAAVDKSTANRLRNTKSLGPFEQLPTGYTQDGKTVRCIDRFVRYPYPPMAISYYKKEYARKDAYAKDHKNAWNLEKETKIINPHRVESNTTNKEVYKGKQGPRAEAKQRDFAEDDAPIQTTSHYQQKFPNWKNADGDIFHEKHPQFPVYSLPFRGTTSYKSTFLNNKIDDLRSQTLRVHKDTSKLPITSYNVTGFDFETTNNKVYQDFKFNKAERTCYQNPAYNPVETNAPGCHFTSTNKKELKIHNYKKPDIDRIPYP